MLFSHSSTSRVHGHLQIMLYKQFFFFLNGVFPAEHLEYVEYVMCVVRLDVKLSVLNGLSTRNETILPDVLDGNESDQLSLKRLNPISTLSQL